jgi:hypothetical protein
MQFFPQGLSRLQEELGELYSNVMDLTWTAFLGISGYWQSPHFLNKPMANSLCSSTKRRQLLSQNDPLLKFKGV